jgi:signal transduction histidine kinase/CheY-like chemotaxis protein
MALPPISLSTPEAKPSSPGATHLRGRLFRKYALLFAGLLSAALVGSGLLDAWFSYREQSVLLARIQQVQADAAAQKIVAFVSGIEQQLVWATQLPWTPEETPTRRREAVRLLRLAPAITELTMLDAQGREQIALSRLAGDHIGRLTDRSAEPAFVAALAHQVFRGPVTFRYGSEPYMALAIAGARPETGVTLAEVNLKFIWDVVSQVRVGTGGLAYVTDAKGRLVAHPNMNLVLSHSDFPGSAQAASGLAASAPVGALGWRVFVELPAEEAYAPLWSSLYRSIALLTLALVLAAWAGLVVVRRMVGPIEALRAGAERIGSGQLSQRLAIKTGDELEVLGEHFNDMAAHLEQSYATLERKVDERTQQLAQANTAQRRFLAVASHDLRQPLVALGLFVEQLRQPLPDRERERLIDRACTAVSDLNELFDALLDLSQLDAGTLTAQHTDVPIQRLFDRLEMTFAGAAQEAGLDLRFVASQAWARSDPILLERILLNLVSNAVRHTQQGGVVVGCRRRGDHLRVEVWDSGPGIPADQRDKIFGEFVRLQPDDAGRPRGLGLGLAIVQRLCGLLGHRMAVESVLGRGSRFSVSVPVGKRGKRGEAAASPSGAAGQTQGLLLSFKGQRLTVIDDDPLVLESLGGLLRTWGCITTTAASASEALALLAQEGGPPALIIADCNLAGGMNGVDAISAVRARWGAGIAAFLISTDATAARMSDARLAGFQLLRKPVSPVMLRALLLSALGTGAKAEPASNAADAKS